MARRSGTRLSHLIELKKAGFEWVKSGEQYKAQEPGRARYLVFLLLSLILCLKFPLGGRAGKATWTSQRATE